VDTNESGKGTNLSASMTSLLFRRTGSDFRCKWWLIPHPTTFSDTADPRKEEQGVNTTAETLQRNQKQSPAKTYGNKKGVAAGMIDKEINDQNEDQVDSPRKMKGTE